MTSPQEIRALQNLKDTDAVHSTREIKDLSTYVEPQGDYNGDEDRLARLGKKQVLQVRHLD